MVRLFAEGRDCAGLMPIALCGWLMLAAVPTGGTHLHHGSGHSVLLHGAAMGLVMLYPLPVEALRHVRRSSFQSARIRQVSLFIAVYGALWASFGLAAAAIPAAVPARLAPAMFAVALGSAWLWQGSLSKRSAAGQCHAAWAVYGGGTAGLSSAASYGARIGIACLLSCGPLMMAAMLSPSPFIAMAAAFLLILRERFGPEAAARENRVLLGLGTMVALMGAGLGSQVAV